MDIDFVQTWVDSSDPAWRAEFLKYCPESDYKPVRYRDLGTLRYWFRAVEQQTPWVHRIYLITNGQRPDWLRTDHPKLRWVTHAEFIPQAFLPTFHSDVIELNLHRIPELAEHFVLFNDDMFLNAPLAPEYFFKEGLPVDATNEAFASSLCCDHRELWRFQLRLSINIGVLNTHFSRNATVRQSPGRWLGFYLGWKDQCRALLNCRCDRFQSFRYIEHHHPQPYLKSIFREAWQQEEPWLQLTCQHKVRCDVELTIYFMRYWQLASNRFYPERHRQVRLFTMNEHKTEPQIRAVLNDRKLKTVCFNDSSDCTHETYMRLKEALVQNLEAKYPQKSSFEL